MPYDWDDNKWQANIDKHGIDFAAIASFDWENASIYADHRMDYAEPRMVAYGTVHQRLIVVVYTDRGDRRRIISMRRANSREVAYYGQGR